MIGHEIGIREEGGDELTSGQDQGVPPASRRRLDEQHVFVGHGRIAARAQKADESDEPVAPEPAGAVGSRHGRRPPGGIHDEARCDGQRIPSVSDGDSPAARFTLYGDPWQPEHDPRAGPLGRGEKYLVEPRPVDAPRGSEGARDEVLGAQAAVAPGRPDAVGRPWTGGQELLPDAQLDEKRADLGGEQLARAVIRGVPAPEQDHGATRRGQAEGDRRPRGTTSDHGDVELRHGSVRSCSEKTLLPAATDETTNPS
jgi:hypothetical protein